MKRLFLIVLIQVSTNCQSNLDTAIIDKYECPTVPAQLSTFNQAISLTGPTKVNKRTIRRSNRIGRLIVKFTNQYRASRGLPPLAWDQLLARVGRPHTVAMARGTKPFSHDGFERRFNWYRNLQPGVISFGENLLYFLNPNISTNAQIARFAVDTWIRSPAHERNLLGNFNRSGVSAFRNINNVWYITQLLALVR
jgi:uncharacterized protein YkwD